MYIRLFVSQDGHNFRYVPSFGRVHQVITTTKFVFVWIQGFSSKVVWPSQTIWFKDVCLRCFGWFSSSNSTGIITESAPNLWRKNQTLRYFMGIKIHGGCRLEKKLSFFCRRAPNKISKRILRKIPKRISCWKVKVDKRGFPETKKRMYETSWLRMASWRFKLASYKAIRYIGTVPAITQGSGELPCGRRRSMYWETCWHFRWWFAYKW